VKNLVLLLFSIGLHWSLVAQASVPKAQSRATSHELAPTPNDNSKVLAARISKPEALVPEAPVPKVQSKAMPQELVPTTNDNSKELAARVSKLEADAVKSAELRRNPLVIAASIAFSASLIGHLIALFTQFAAAKRSLNQAKLEAAFSQAEKIVEFKTKQLELFYAPVFALLMQSKALYIKMSYILAETEPTKYKRLEEPDPEGYRLHVVDDSGQSKGFRLLDQLPAVRTNPHALPLVDGIIEIGNQLTKIISEHAGLASADLVGLLGEYMAHYAIISSVYKGNSPKPYAPGWHKMGYYPTSLNKRIEVEYREINRFIEEYANASKNVLQAHLAPTDLHSR
jgi:hypothetical protein